ncbi:hypothetical protein X756_31540 [Mesorhizobium sp. LSHC412B00]|nr:hypothetical protein X756_31540 [Mesorhizobium sp. LSHC412B00]
MVVGGQYSAEQSYQRKGPSVMAHLTEHKFAKSRLFFDWGFEVKLLLFFSGSCRPRGHSLLFAVGARRSLVGRRRTKRTVALTFTHPLPGPRLLRRREVAFANYTAAAACWLVRRTVGTSRA